MSSLPNEILSVIANFLPNDDITDLMLMSRNFIAVVTPRLRKIDEEMSTTNQSIKSFMPSPVPDATDNKWISELNLKRFMPIGSVAKKRAKEVLEHDEEEPKVGFTILERLRKGMSLERFNDMAFLRILGALVSVPKFRQEYNISFIWAKHQIMFLMICTGSSNFFDDVHRIWSFYNEQ